MLQERSGQFKGMPPGATRMPLIQRYVVFVVRHRVAVVLAVLIVTALFITQFRYLRLEIRRRAQLPQGHPYVQIQNEIADRFGGDTTMIIGVIAEHGDIFTPEILGKIVRITRQLEGLPGVVPSNLLSIASKSVKLIRATAEGMDVRPLLDEVPGEAAARAQLKADVLNDEIYAGILVARDGSAAAIVADFDERLSDAEIYAAVKAAVEPERDSLVEIALGGSPVIRVYSAQYTRAMAILFPIAVIVIALVHYEAFRTFQAMLLPLLTALLSVAWALGIMATLRQPMDTWSAITPVVILAVAAGHAVQILKRYYEEYARVGDSEQAVVRSVVAIGPVMLTAGMIAAAGFGSLVTFDVMSVRVFGMLLAAGILSALAIEMTFTPACRAMLPAPRGIETRREREGRYLSAALEWLAVQVVDRPHRVVGAAVLLLAVSLAGATRLRVDNSLRAWFPEDSPLRVDDRLLNDRLAGTSTLYLLLEGRAEGDLERPEVLRAIGDLQAWLERQPQVGATLSLADFVKRMHRAMSGGRGVDAAIPDNRRLIAQYLFLYSLSGPDDFNHLVDPSHRVGVLRAYAKSDEADFASGLFERLNTFVAGRFRGLPVQPRIAGGALGVQVAMNQVVVREKIRNVTQVVLLIFGLSSLVLRSFVGGLLVLAPLTIAVAVSLGTMGLTGTWLSIATATFTAMAVGIGADFAVYLIFRLREELRARGGEARQAVRAALQTSGKAIFFVSSAVVLGYLVLALSGFRVWMYLGFLTALMMAASALGALTIIPVAAMLIRPRFLWGHADSQQALDAPAAGADTVAEE